MARGFNGSTQYLEVDSAAITGTPFTICAWAKSDSATAFQAVITIIDKSSGIINHGLYFAGSITGDPIRAASRNDAAGNAETSTGYTVGTWHHVAGIWTTTTDRKAYIDGGSEGSDTTSIDPTGLDRTSIGRLGRVDDTDYFDGNIAEMAVWDVALTTAELAWLAKGFSPLLLIHRFGDLVMYKDLIRDINRPYIGPTLVNSGSTAANHTRMFYPAPPMIISVPGVALTVPEMLAAISGNIIIPRRRQPIMLPF